ncbi:MAG: universal stress protein [Acidobacteriota bacterium]
MFKDTAMNSPMRILIAYDGSESANIALKELHRAYLPHQAQAIVTTIVETWLPLPPSYANATEDLSDSFPYNFEGARAMAARACEQLRTQFPQWDLHSHLHVGSPASVLIKKAASWQADLIVVGTHGRSALGRFLLGSVSQKVLTGAQCSVRIARQLLRSDTAMRILIGVDGSASAVAAAQAVTARSWPAGSEVRLVTAIGPFSLADANLNLMFRTVGLESTEEFKKAELDFAYKSQQRLEPELSAAGLKISKIVKQGDPKHLLLAEAQTWKADTIFLGSTGLGRLERFLLGSVSAAVAARAHCSVEIVRTNSLLTKV